MNKREIAKRMKQDQNVTSGNTYTNKMYKKHMAQKGKESVLMPKGEKNEGENMMIDKKGNQRA